MSDLEELWRDHMAAQQRWRELLKKLPTTPADWINASPEERMKDGYRRRIGRSAG
jgi:hypothetical protein